MIVDNEEDIAQIYESFISSVGYRVRTFIDSDSALPLFDFEGDVSLITASLA